MHSRRARSIATVDNAAHGPIGGEQFAWDEFLKPGQIRFGMDGIWHIGRGSDLHKLLFEASLTAEDEKFLRSLRVGV